jgi:hypothetical protein
MVNGEEGEFIRYYPEKVNRPHGAALTGKTPDQGHMANWIECVRSRKAPNAPVEIGYRSAIAVHMANSRTGTSSALRWKWQSPSLRNSDVLACRVHRSCSGLYHSQGNG